MRKSTFVAAASMLLLAAGRPALAYEDPPKPSNSAPDLSGLHAFDFIAGKWKTHHRRLKERLMGSHEWVDFDGTQDAHLLMNGAANMDDNAFNLPSGAYSGVTLRAYDSKTGEWSIWWLDGRMPSVPIDPPVRGKFVNGIGTFYADDTLRGKLIKVRFTWHNLTPTTSHWEQAFSPDGGKTWEVNWTTDFVKVSK
jgi:hypothetical protein